jgi:hypothetical protein
MSIRFAQKPGLLVYLTVDDLDLATLATLAREPKISGADPLAVPQ